MKQEEIKAKRSDATYVSSVKGVEREVYFLTDTGTMKYGHRIENKSRALNDEDSGYGNKGGDKAEI